MEFLIEHLSLIFSYFTGILITWGLYLGYEHHNVISFNKTVDNSHCLADEIQMKFLFVMSLILAAILFVFPTSITHILDILFGLEIWYAVSLSRISVNVYKSLKLIHEITPKLDHPKHIGPVL